ncbi:MAG: CoxG family protein [Nitriliruptoraceae bacterium]
MEFHTDLRVPSDVETTFAALRDLDTLAPCFPGASIEQVEGDTATGQLTVKVGPLRVTYHGTAELAEADSEARTGRIIATGREARGSGNARAEVSASLTDEGGTTRVALHTELEVTGRPAQFGQGVLAEVAERLTGAVAEQLTAELAEEPASTAAPSAPQPAPIDEPAVAAAAMPREATPAARALPLVLAAALAMVLLWWWRSR